MNAVVTLKTCHFLAEQVLSLTMTDYTTAGGGGTRSILSVFSQVSSLFYYRSMYLKVASFIKGPAKEREIITGND